MKRKSLLAATVAELEKNGFITGKFFGSNTCFDIIARKGGETLAIKVYENIDAIRKEQGGELKKLSKVLCATPLIIGEKTKVFNLKDNVVYTRYGIAAVTSESFRKMVSENTNPEVRYFKGREIVELNSEELGRKREELKMSMAELAQKIGVAADTLHRFEKGRTTSLETARKLEKELDAGFVKKIDVLGKSEYGECYPETTNDRLLEKMLDLGMPLAFFSHTPFSAFGKTREGIFISTGRGKADIPKKALELREASRVINSDSLIVTPEYKCGNINGIPVIWESDLDTISRLKELRKLIEEREKE